MTHEELALKLGRSRSSISNALRLLCLPASLQERLLTGSLSAGHARALLGLAEQAQQERIATRVVVDGLSVRATEELVRTLTEDTVNGRAAPAVLTAPTSRHPVSLFAEAERRLAHALATTVALRGRPGVAVSSSSTRGPPTSSASLRCSIVACLLVTSTGTGKPAAAWAASIANREPHEVRQVGSGCQGLMRW